MLRRGEAALATVVLLAALMSPTAAADAASCDVGMFGARGDGITDDTQAINAALATATPCDTVIFPGGTYRVTGALAIGSDRIVQGAGKGRTVIASASATSNVFSMTGSPATGRLTIRDLTVSVAAGTTKTAGAGILVSGGTTRDHQGTMVDNVEILDMPTGVDISGGQFSVTNSQAWYRVPGGSGNLAFRSATGSWICN